MRLVALLVIVLPLSGCGAMKKLGKMGVRKANREPLPQELEATALEIQNSKFVQQCDHQYGQARIDISRELDRRHADIVRIQKESPVDEDVKRVTVGPISIDEPFTQPKLEDKWEKFTLGWPDAQRLWDEYQADPSDENLVGLNSVVRSLMFDDRNRVLHGVNVYLTRTDLKSLINLRDQVNACAADANCTRPNYSDDARSLATKNDYYRSYFRDNYFYQDREALTKWLKDLNIDVEDKEFTKNETIKRLDANTLEVPMNPGNFAGFENELTRFFEAVWKTDKLAVKVKWQQIEDIFSIVINNEVGGRAFVRYGNKSMNIADGVTSTTLAHEFGHVLGLTDEYYTTWNKDTCTYQFEYNPSNIMSDSAGVPQQSHWDLLNSHYAN